MGLATARGGNVIGGGDWSPHRIVPDIVRALRSRQPLRLRRPEATRPWQHVLDLSYGYLLLGYRLAVDAKAEEGGQAWNFGPAPGPEVTVNALAEAFLARWGEPDYRIERVKPLHEETTILRLDSSRAIQMLGWQPLLNGATAIDWTADWYRRYLQDTDAASRLVEEQLKGYEDLLVRKPLPFPISVQTGSVPQIRVAGPRSPNLRVIRSSKRRYPSPSLLSDVRA